MIKEQELAQSLFKAMTEESSKRILQEGVVRTYPKNSSIFTQGDLINRFFIIIDGWVKLYNTNVFGQESGLVLLTRGAVFGAEGLYGDHSYLYSAETVAMTSLLDLSAKVLLEGVRQRPAVAAWGMSFMSERIKDMQVMDACASLKIASQRVACLLLRLSSQMIGDGGTFRLPYEKAVAAAQLGMDHATFSRALAQLKEQGVTSGNGEVSIGDFYALSDYCCKGCPIPANRCGGRRTASEEENPLMNLSCA